jgi:integrase
VGQRPVKLPRYVHAFIDRHGRPRFYLRRKGQSKVPLPGLPWSPRFMEVYTKALDQTGKIEIGAARTIVGTVNACVVAYYKSPDFARDISKGTQTSQRSLIERFRGEHGDKRLRMLERRHVQAYINCLESPAVQRNMLRALKHFLKFCLGSSLIAENPADGVTRAKMKNTGGFVPWSEQDVAKFTERHPVGSMARLALGLYLNLGVRKSDVVRIGPRHIRDGELTDFQPQKTSHNGGKKITVPLLEETKALIAATPLTGTDTFLVTSYGKPFTANGFGNKMAEWCKEAGLAVRSHGLRKLCLTRLAEAGCTVNQIAAISGHKDLREIQLYVDSADRKRLARDGIAQLWKMNAQMGNELVANLESRLANPEK